MLENGQFDDSFIENNADILHLVENKEQLYKYLLNNKINIVHDNQDLALDIINNNRIIVLSYSVIDPEKEYDRNELKKQHENINIGLQVVFID